MAIQIIVDSTSEVSQEQAKEMGITVIPLSVYFGEEQYEDGIDISTDLFFDKLVKCEDLPTTSQINFLRFESEFQKHIDNGDEVLGIFLSSELSGTCQSAIIAKNNIESDKITIVDSQQVTLCYRLIVEKAVEMRDKGFSVAEIEKALDKLKTQVFFLAVVEDLTYLKKGGRLSATSATVGSLLGIKPIVTSKSGKIEVAHKVRGAKKAYEHIINQAIENGLNENTKCFIAHGQHLEAYTEFKNQLILRDISENVRECRIGSTVGTYAGPECVGICFFKED